MGGERGRTVTTPGYLEYSRLLARRSVDLPELAVFNRGVGTGGCRESRARQR
jgi:hypothetical protein